MPVHVLVAAIALQRSYAAGIEPSVDDVMVFHSWAVRHGPDVSADVEAVMHKHGMVEEPKWFAHLTRSNSSRGGTPRP